MLRTVARPADGGWVIEGEKWFITGGVGAAFAIVMARTEGGATMLLVDAGTEGFVVEEAIDTIDRVSPGGHARMRFSDCFVPAEHVLGEPGQAFRYAQVRLAPARLTHCMRWLGLARRSLDIALERAVDRELFGSRLTDLGLAQRLIADAEIDLQTSRLMIAHVAELLDAGRDAGVASSMAKVHVSEAVFRVIDSAIQLSGSDGITVEPLGRYLAEVRPFRIYDGSNETHRWSIARRAARAVRTARDEAAAPQGPAR
jgi:acyl-CoA dehydrogenase